MKSAFTFQSLTFVFILAFCPVLTHGAGLERVRVNEKQHDFELAPSGKPFRVWGVNYDHDANGNGRLLEDYWEDEWNVVREDFEEIKALGANVVRIHLQFGKFMSAEDLPNSRSLDKLKDLLTLAEETGLYLDLTGLGCYHKADVPSWYDSLDETRRWKAQARFWSAVAQAGKDSNAVFCYDLMNEPVISGKAEEGWLTGQLGGKFFVQRLTLTPGKRSNTEIAKSWVEQMTAAIRSEDANALITVGAIPWAMVWPSAKPLFYSPEVSAPFDFVSIHVYPARGEVDKALAAIGKYEIGKPILIEETFPLKCGLDEMEDFLQRSKDKTDGYISFYWGKTIEQYSKTADENLASALMRGWLKYFQEQATRYR